MRGSCPCERGFWYVTCCLLGRGCVKTVWRLREGRERLLEEWVMWRLLRQTSVKVSDKSRSGSLGEEVAVGKTGSDSGQDGKQHMAPEVSVATNGRHVVMIKFHYGCCFKWYAIARFIPTQNLERVLLLNELPDHTLPAVQLIPDQQSDLTQAFLWHSVRTSCPTRRPHHSTAS